jgi:hypothetical protein
MQGTTMDTLRRTELFNVPIPQRIPELSLYRCVELKVFRMCALNGEAVADLRLRPVHLVSAPARCAMRPNPRRCASSASSRN